MDIRAVERYILLGYDDSSLDFHIKAKFLSFSILFGFFTVLIFVFGLGILRTYWEGTVLNFELVVRHNPLVYMIVVSLILLMAFLAVKNGQYAIKGFAGETNNKNDARKYSFFAGATAGIPLVILFRHFSQYPDLWQTIITVLATANILVFSLFMFSFLYKIYVLEKYCPYLVTPKDRRYDKDTKVKQ